MTNLTEQWKNGELKSGIYYINHELMGIIQAEYEANYNNWYNFGCDVELSNENIKKVLAPVPSYKEWQAKDSEIDFLQQKISVLESKVKKYDNIKVNGNYPDKISKLKSRVKNLTEQLDSTLLTNKALTRQLQPFTDPYFTGLETKEIAELAKKSIRLTKWHCEDNREIMKLKELLKDCRFMLREMSDINNWFEGDDCEINYYMSTECGKYVTKIDEVLK